MRFMEEMKKRRALSDEIYGRNEKALRFMEHMNSIEHRTWSVEKITDIKSLRSPLYAQRSNQNPKPETLN